MRSLLFVLSLALCASCPGPGAPDGGAGGGVAGGSAGGTAGGGSAGGAPGGGSAGGAAGGTAGGSAGGAAPIDPAAFCEARAQLDVQYQISCGYLDPAQRDDALLDSRTGCANRRKLHDAGSTTFAPAAAAACLQRYDAGCTDFTIDPFAECALNRAFGPTAMLGAPCSFGDCIGSTCGAGASSCGACIAFRQVGDVCDQGRACDPSSAYCSFIPAADGGRRCRAAFDAGAFCLEFNSCKGGGSCLTLIDGGRACGPLPLGAPCGSIDTFDFKHCGAPAYCRGLVAGVRTGACTGRLGFGATCTDEAQDDGCPAGASCLDGTCTLARYSRLRGQTCDGPGQCVITDQCDVESNRGLDGGMIRDGHCVARPGVDAGCPQGLCAPALSCIGGACTPRPRGGEGCDPVFGVCGNSLRCVRVQDDAGYFCLPRRDAGSPCEAYQDVCRDSFCPTGAAAPVCTPRVPAGSACLTSLDCTTDRCVPKLDGGSGGECVAPCL